MPRYRLSGAAQVDVINILAWTHEQFGEAARLRHENLIVAALREVATQPDRPFDRSKLGGVAAARQASRKLPVTSDSRWPVA